MLLRSVLIALLAASPALAAEEPCQPVRPCEVPDAGPGPAREPPADFTSEARQLFDLLSCQGKPPDGLDALVVKAHCARQARLAARAGELRAPLRELLGKLHPERMPSTVVYPLAGVDLLGALLAYPEARNVTLTSSRPAGDPRLLARLRDPGRLAAFLESVSAEGEKLLRGEGGETSPPRRAGRPTAALPVLLWALAVEGAEPVGLRYLRLEPAGTLRYLGAGEIASAERNKEGPDPFESCELSFVRRREAKGTLPRIVRHLGVDLSEEGLRLDPGDRKSVV
jgi:hypothetical protein